MSDQGKRQDNGKDHERGLENAFHSVQHAAQHAIHNVESGAAHGVHEVRRTLRADAQKAKESASHSLLTAADKIRRDAAKSGHKDAIEHANHLATRIEKAAVYLEGHSLEQVGDAATTTIRRRPWQIVGVAFLCGLLIGFLLHGQHS